jgi:hypothetical protein
MRRIQLLLSLLVLLIPLIAAGAEVGPVSPEGQDYAYIVGSLKQSITAPCSGEVKPDRAHIVGGITAESLKPAEAREEIERQLAEIQKYVSQQGGIVHVLERVRAVRGVPRDARNVRMDQLPFVVIQRLEMEFPLGIDIDEMLERLLQLGLDRYGRNVRLNSQDTTPKVVVRYRFSDLTATLKGIHQQCKTQALQHWCEMSTPAAEHEACTRALNRISRRFITQSLMLQSGPVLGEHGQSTLVQISYPWNEAQLSTIELVGDVPLRLHGSITVKLPGDRGW